MVGCEVWAARIAVDRGRPRTRRARTAFFI
jgi:hypothetical protein